MTTRTIVSALFVFALALHCPPLARAASESFTVDGVHSTLIFKAKHLGVSNFYGRFNAISGTLTFDDADSKKSAVAIEVKTETVDTGNEKRDQHLKSPDFLSAKEFPTISFKSKEIKKSGDGVFEIEGDFTLHGVTKAIKVKAERTGSGKNPRSGKALSGFETTFTFKRSDFGMKGMIPMIGDEVQITISVEAEQA